MICDLRCAWSYGVHDRCICDNILGIKDIVFVAFVVSLDSVRGIDSPLAVDDVLVSRERVLQVEWLQCAPDAK